MTKDELAKNLGTIARSGTGEFLKKAEEKGGADGNLIGQFGTSHLHCLLRFDTDGQVSVSTVGKLREPEARYQADVQFPSLQHCPGIFPPTSDGPEPESRTIYFRIHFFR
jgi:hypothetical protein